MPPSTLVEPVSVMEVPHAIAGEEEVAEVQPLMTPFM
jgi:hypothetical protein